ncbi:NF038122 family metalloprotease [Sphingomonas sp. A2-49]|uniref:NF038122 family metalloprotease n=1 Tax=Sphingomonas sp. A2-49 TaxID=1391375 RepID=UPI0021CE1595|nr:NF038122 family metalloprotease [Sphingomonas sp. A2-49]MCU6453890.1 NF038122 family metalloprotease [Sphingomonas sp. A2-49]
MSRLSKSLLLGAIGMATAVASPASALTFNLIDLGGAGAGSQARMGFDIATAYWSSVLKSDAVVNLQIGFTSLGGNILAQAGSNASAAFNSQVYAGLRSTATSSVDALALAHLQPLGDTLFNGNQALTVTTNAFNAAGDGYVDTATRLDDNRSLNNQALYVNNSLVKALGITSDANGNAVDFTAPDAVVSFSTDYKFDFDPTDGIASDAIDFIGVAIHEIGHSLGFISGVDTYDQYTGPGSGETFPGGVEDFGIGTVLDLFRYSAPGKLDWSTQDTPYFSIDGGQTQVFGDSRFSTGILNGDGRQASHWKDLKDPLGLMDPTVAYGQSTSVTALDLVAFDAIGWKLAFDPLLNPGYKATTASIYRDYQAGAVPEPAAWGMMIVGFALVGGALRRRRPVRTVVRFT